jgi:hypothetical protein
LKSLIAMWQTSVKGTWLKEGNTDFDQILSTELLNLILWLIYSLALTLRLFQLIWKENFHHCQNWELFKNLSSYSPSNCISWKKITGSSSKHYLVFLGFAPTVFTLSPDKNSRAYSKVISLGFILWIPI